LALEILTIGPAGQIELPDQVRDRYGMAPATPIRIVETRGGVLLVPLGDFPMSPELAEELAQWQALGAQSWEMFPFDEESESS
jgi:bifunctional DNA-binding transcriptional regulator/antitoxin component of YhaV-PrlF toxin-antitoxin module